MLTLAEITGSLWGGSREEEASSGEGDLDDVETGVDAPDE